MGAFSDNFYSWLEKEHAAEKAAMDASPNGYKHPDGSPCRAKSIDTCPYYKKEQHEAVKVDALDPVANVQLKSTSQEYNGIKKGADPESKNVRAVRPDELTTMKPGSTKSKYRELRNVAFAALMKKKEAGENVDGTYPLDDPEHKVTHKDKAGKDVPGFADGWQVSFQTTNGEGFNKRSKDGKFVSDEDYDRIVDELSEETHSKPYLGVFGDIPEISFRCKTYKQAMEIAKRFNQVSIANNARIAQDIWDGWTFPTNHDYDWRGNQTFVMK